MRRINTAMLAYRHMRKMYILNKGKHNLLCLKGMQNYDWASWKAGLDYWRRKCNLRMLNEQLDWRLCK